MSHLPFYSNGIKNKQLLFQCFYAYLDFNCTFYFIGIIFENTESSQLKSNLIFYFSQKKSFNSLFGLFSLAKI